MKIYQIYLILLLLISYSSFAQRSTGSPYMDSIIRSHLPPNKGSGPMSFPGGRPPGNAPGPVTDVMDDLPKKNLFNQYKNVPALNNATLIALAKTILNKAITKLDQLTINDLNKIASDTTVNVAGTGVFMLQSGLPRYVGEYLISKGVIANTKDVWAVNDLGVVFRGYKMYKEAVQCFAYCVKLADSSAIFNTNLGWAVAYYGDLEAAKRFFRKAVFVNDQLMTAWEGLGTIAYIEGNTAELFQCLAKQVKGIGGGSGSEGGPSASMVGLCGGVQMQSIDLTGKDETDPTQNNMFDAGSSSDGNEDEPAGNANDEPPTYPSMQPLFIKDISQLGAAVTMNISQRFTDEQKRLNAICLQKKQALTPMPQPPYVDAGGNRIIPYNYQKWVQLYGDVDMLFSQRLGWVSKQYRKKIEKLVNDFGNEEYDLLKGYTDAMAACGGSSEECVNRVLCTWIPKFRTAKNADLAAAYQVWEEYFGKLLVQVNWFIDATSPFIRKVHQQQWNEYLNADRSRKVRLAILGAYNQWFDAMVGVNNSGALTALIGANQQLDCHVEVREIGGSNDPTSKKVKKLKTFAGPCYKEETEINFFVGKYIDNCDKTRIELGPDNFRKFWEKDYSKKFKEDDYYKSGLTVGVSESVGGEIWKLKGKAELSAQFTFFKTYDGNGNITEQGREVDLAATAEAKVETGVNAIDDKLTLKKGVSAHIVVSTMVGQNQAPDYRITQFSTEKISEGFK